MQLFYEGTDITDSVSLSQATCIDSAGDGADCLSVKMESASDWLRWSPKRDDKIELVADGYRTGAMYIDVMTPDASGYGIMACSMPSAARRRAWASYERVTLGQLIRMLASEMDMGVKLYGVPEHARYAYLVRRNETTAGFLSRVLAMEGAVLKCCCGNLVAVSVEWAQNQSATQELELSGDLQGVTVTSVDGVGYGALSIVTPGGTGTARDYARPDDRELVLANESAEGIVQAARWARGRLLIENRQRTKLQWAMAYNPSMTALIPVSIAGPGDLSGDFLVQTAKHDFVALTTDVTLYRCVDTIF